MIPSTIFFEAGLGSLVSTVRDNWLGPIFLIGVAAFALVFIKDRQWMKLIGFVGIAAVVGVLIFAGGSFFGKDGALTGAAKTTGEKVKNGGSNTGQ